MGKMIEMMIVILAFSLLGFLTYLACKISRFREEEKKEEAPKFNQAMVRPLCDDDPRRVKEEEDE